MIKKRRLTKFSLLALIGLLLVALPVLAEVAGPNALRPAIDAQYRGVDWVSTKTLASWMAASADRQLVLLDIREPGEFRVSHLRDARLVDPDLTSVASLNIARDSTVIVYCSVGYRSAAMAQRFESAGYERVFNLQGGLFQWANEGRPLFRGARSAQQVHPYDNDWGRMLLERYRSPI